MKTYNPTTPSRRFIMTPNQGVVRRARPNRRLLKTIGGQAGRNNTGRITVRHQGGGNKRRYRVVDFAQRRMDIPARVETIEYDPYRTAFIAGIVYRDGQRAYVLAPQNIAIGDTIVTAEKAEVKTGNRMRLRNIPVGYQVYNAELFPHAGGSVARSAGSFAEVLAHEDGYTHLRIGSGEVRRAHWDGLASLGQVSNAEHNLMVVGKAGRARWLGVRPTVRGSVMNPVDHPYGGGEGRTQRGTRRPKTLWGKITGGRKTRKRRNRSNVFIIQRTQRRKGGA
ncbi:MAG: 50S ribosomal protein L2 [Candidatus Liptonbacteria bacterium]|nr:50S ribosomal protein L2 [Candidatus Liptonbacteria bacterium]